MNTVVDLNICAIQLHDLWPLNCRENPKDMLSAMSFFSTVSKITLLCSLESCFRKTWTPLPLLVRILHKSRLRYYGKFGLKIDYPYQVSLNFPRIWRLGNKISHSCVVTECSLLVFHLMFLSYFRHTLKLLTRVGQCPLCFGTNFVQSFTRD